MNENSRTYLVKDDKSNDKIKVVISKTNDDVLEFYKKRPFLLDMSF